MTHFQHSVANSLFCSRAGGQGREVWAVCSTTPIINNELLADESIHTLQLQHGVEWSVVWAGAGPPCDVTVT